MRVYHGSDRNFKKLRIGKSLVRCDSTIDNEGIGIYFSLDKKVAKSYGKYLYTLEINDDCILDFRSKSVCNWYVNRITQDIYRKTNVDISEFIDLSNVSDRMYWGELAIANTCREIYMLLDSTESWFNLSESKINKIYSMLRAYDKKHLQAYLFNYIIKDTGIIKNVDESVVELVHKQRSY